MDVQKWSERISDTARDIRVNVQNLSQLEHTPGLTKEQMAGVFLACAYTMGDRSLVDAAHVQLNPSPELVAAAQSAAAIMAMILF